MFLILGLPILMYPLFVGVGLLFVVALKEKRLVVGVVGAEHLPKPGPADLDPRVPAAARERAIPSTACRPGPALLAARRAVDPRYSADGRFRHRPLSRLDPPLDDGHSSARSPPGRWT